MLLEKKKFDDFVSKQPLVAYNVNGDEFSIKMDLNEVASKGFSRILGRYINEQKAQCENGFAYLRPDYDTICLILELCWVNVTTWQH